MADVTQGFVVGKGIVEGVRCDHLAFRAPHADWQIWIQEGKEPLPRKLVITNRADEARPQSVTLMEWNLKPAFNEASFKFTPPKGASKIEMVPVKTK